MKLNKLYELLQKISPHEWQGFKASIVIQEDEQLLKYTKLIDQHRSNMAALDLKNKKHYSAIFSEKKTDDVKIWHLNSKMLKILEKYIISRELEKDEFTQRHYLLQYYNRIGLDKHFEQTFLESKQQNETNSTNKLHNNYLLHHEKDIHFLNKQVREFDNNLQLKSDAIDLYFILNKLKTACEMFNRQQIIPNAVYQSDIIEVLLNYIQQRKIDFKTQPLIYSYYLTYKMLTGNTDNTGFNKLKLFLADNFLPIDKKELRSVYSYVQNYLIRNINKGNAGLLEELYAMYITMLEQGLLTENKQMTQWDYKNIINLGIRLKKYDYTQTFIESYKTFLPEELSATAYSYNLGLLHFTKKNYREVLRLLQRVEFNDVSYNIETKLLLLKTYYETDELESFLALTEAFKIYLIRNKQLSQVRKAPHLNFIRFCKKAFNAKMGGKTKLKEVIQKVETEPMITEKRWLTEKLAELNP